MRQKTQLIGRQDEKAVLINGFLELQRGSALQTVMLQGEAGIGKSQLVEELVRQAEASQIKILLGKAMPLRRTIPIMPGARHLTVYSVWRRSYENRNFQMMIAKPFVMRY